ncbi:MAG: 30S ribosomal protein S13 [Proteobacteria bacterium]|nr:30S ribosomal protein S13 [Pseudomonadota bacterium]
MARIAGVDLPGNKKIVIALTSIFGVGRRQAQRIVKEAGISPDIKAADVGPNEANNIRRVIEASILVEGDLKREVGLSIKRLMDLNSYRGFRHRKSLPVRGQRSKTNARTRKGPRKTVANKKKAAPG